MTMTRIDITCDYYYSTSWFKHHTFQWQGSWAASQFIVETPEHGNLFLNLIILPCLSCLAALFFSTAQLAKVQRVWPPHAQGTAVLCWSRDHWFGWWTDGNYRSDFGLLAVLWHILRNVGIISYHQLQSEWESCHGQECRCGTGVGREWDGSGTGVGREWDGSGTGVGREWDGSGTGVGREWDGSGTGVGREWDGSGTGMGREWDGSGTGVGRERDGRCLECSFFGFVMLFVCNQDAWSGFKPKMKMSTFFQKKLECSFFGFVMLFVCNQDAWSGFKPKMKMSTFFQKSWNVLSSVLWCCLFAIRMLEVVLNQKWRCQHFSKKMLHVLSSVLWQKYLWNRLKPRTDLFKKKVKCVQQYQTHTHTTSYPTINQNDLQ